jgi:DNA-directed RNA polymerase I subunit RPA43
MTSSISSPASGHTKRKHHASDAGPDAPRKKKKEKSKQEMGKPRAKPSTSEFRVTKATITLSIPPVFASNLRAGAEEMLDSMIMRYIPSLCGVLLAHSNLHFLSPTASINSDCPFAICNVAFDATVWSPSIAMKLVGKIILYSPDHVSLLLHRTFNVSIPRHHIPQDVWEFEYGPAENDPEYGEGVVGSSVDKDGDVGMKEGDGEKAESDTIPEASGQWVHRLTGTKLGGTDGYLEFTVIGKTVANEMLSLQGSIQPDPFSEEHLATQSGKSSRKKSTE